MVIEMANLAGLSHAGAPVITVGSTTNPTRAPARTTSISAAVVMSSGLVCHSRRNIVPTLSCNVIIVNIRLSRQVDDVNICSYDGGPWQVPPRNGPGGSALVSTTT